MRYELTVIRDGVFYTVMNTTNPVVALAEQNIRRLLGETVKIFRHRLRNI